MDGMRNEDRDYSVTAIHFPCLDDRAELEPEALESGGLSSDSGHALLSWRTGAHDFLSPSVHFLSSITVYLQGLLSGSF